VHAKAALSSLRGELGGMRQALFSDDAGCSGVGMLLVLGRRDQPCLMSLRKTVHPGDRWGVITIPPQAALAQAADRDGQTTLYLTSMHGKKNLLKPRAAKLRAAVQRVKVAAEPLKSAKRCALLISTSWCEQLNNAHIRAAQFHPVTA